jgi:hypothetical protein
MAELLGLDDKVFFYIGFVVGLSVGVLINIFG